MLKSIVHVDPILAAIRPGGWAVESSAIVPCFCKGPELDSSVEHRDRMVQAPIPW
jgi:hypothetical protein